MKEFFILDTVHKKIKKYNCTFDSRTFAVMCWLWADHLCTRDSVTKQSANNSTMVTVCCWEDWHSYESHVRHLVIQSPMRSPTCSARVCLIF